MRSGIPKTKEYFSVNKFTSLGNAVYRSWCKACCAEKKRQRRMENPEHEREIDRQRHERDKEKRHEQSKDYRDRNRDVLIAKQRRKRDENRDQYNARQRIKYAENLETGRQYQRSWRINNPEKAHVADHRKREKQKLSPAWREKNKAKRRALDAQRRHAPGRFTILDVNKKYITQRGLCRWCSCRLNGKFHIDHIVPIARGGTHYPDNIAASCASCNFAKGWKLPYVEWQPPNPLYPPGDFSADPD